jgi:Cys-rich four helix bundle protein (predicted Tat secretion target)
MNDIHPDITNIERRALLKGAGAATMAAAATFTLNGLAQAMQHQKTTHHHEKSTLPLQELADASTHCVKIGEICRDHCIHLFKSGDTSVADCADAVNQMIASCTAMSKLAIYDNRHIPEFMRVCAKICADCENECRKHADMHLECKACADACADCIKVIEATLS